MKKIFLLLCLFFFFFPVFASSGIFIGEGKIFHAKTKYFDIIYSERSKESAEKLFYAADSIYEKIAEDYGHEIWFKMPVVVSPANENSNAYFSFLYYPHIVIYDTAETEELRNNNGDVLATFTHELTHAYTLLLKNEFWQTIGNIFWLGINAQALSITAGWTEGAAVLQESSNGIEGRLNDGWALQMLKQAKIEGVFPTYHDVQGADDKYPIGSFYYFNAFFHLWLKENYGMEKYSEFWWRCVNMKSITAGGAFQKVYGKKLKTAWNEFYDSIDVSEIAVISKNDDIFGFGGNGFVIKNLVQSRENIAFIEAKTSSVWISNIPATRQGGITISDSPVSPNSPTPPKKLFTLSGIEKIAISRDGRYLACTYLSSRHANYKKHVKIYDIEKKRFYELGETGIQDATILQCESSGNIDYYLIALKFSSQHKSIVVKKLDFEKGDFHATDISNFPQKTGSYPYSFVDKGNGYFSYIEKSGMNWSIKTRNISALNDESQCFEMPEGMNIRYLAHDEKLGGLVFSYAEKDGFPKEGRVVFSEDGSHKTIFSENQESGGVYYPTGEFYVKKFYRESGVFKESEAELNKTLEMTTSLKTDKTLADTSKKEESKNTSEIAPHIAQSNGESESSFDAVTKRYNYFLYPQKGLFLPIAYFSSYETNPLSEKFLDTTDVFGAGALYITANPWDKGIFMVTGGYFLQSQNYGAAISYSSGTDTSLFSYALASQVEFNKTSFQENRNTISLTSSIPVFNFSHLIFSNTSILMFGENSLIYGKNTASAAFTTIHKTGTSVYEKGGFSFGASQIFEAATVSILGKRLTDNAILLSPILTVRIPHLLPIQNKDFYTYNLPLRLSIQGFSGNNNYFSATGELYLFAREVEKAVPFFTAIFINRFLLSVGYNYNLWDSDEDLKANIWNIGKTSYCTDSIFVSFTLGATPNFGQAARNQLYMEFSTNFLFKIRKDINEKSNFAWNLGIKANFL